jgi:hypothetical protein
MTSDEARSRILFRHLFDVDLGGVISQRQTRLFSESSISPVFLNPHFWRTRVEAFISGRVCAQTVLTRSQLAAKSTKAVAAWVAKRCSLGGQLPSLVIGRDAVGDFDKPV